MHHSKWDPRIAVVGLLGQAGHGKSTCANNIVDYCQRARSYQSDYNGLPACLKTSFAATIKEAAQTIFGIDLQTPKNNPLPLYGGLTPRKIYQDLGTWALNYNPYIWAINLWNRVVAWANTLEPMPPNVHGPLDGIVIIDDVRYTREVDFIRAMGGYIIRIATDEGAVMPAGTESHPSEIEQLTIPQNKIDYTIYAKKGDLQTLRSETEDLTEYVLMSNPRDLRLIGIESFAQRIVLTKGAINGEYCTATAATVAAG